ncbi:trans-aconitate 2-methyltransferase [Amaricoccus macauensis]|uniref:Trans-aconitate 2-methyltransferase n=1 Tax=Amaricoccus macauensis TaxID=57001 RepID=A0A840ST57_9RHOB|nr:trans-aconitate 2-methyltransferase [Amaricoccus macauensis]MBB5223940.1 trans-aconitate 2-methyltransferase [Amaricoccus macauensis]
MDWSARQYTKFESERSRPCAELLARVPGEVRRAVDLGCGPGNSTELILARWPEARVSALDSSPDMVAAARERLPGVEVVEADLVSWDDPGPFDLILANAVLQWVPEHERVFPALVERLAPGGSLAVQMPDNLDEPSHRLMREVAADPRWAGRIGDAAGLRTPRRPAEWYAGLLHGLAGVDLWRTTYFHPLAGAAGIVEWLKGTGLRPFLEPLGADERAGFLAAYEAAVAEAYPALPDGTVLLPFPRLFIVATRGR